MIKRIHQRDPFRQGLVLRGDAGAVIALRRASFDERDDAGRAALGWPTSDSRDRGRPSSGSRGCDTLINRPVVTARSTFLIPGSEISEADTGGRVDVGPPGPRPNLAAP